MKTRELTIREIIVVLLLGVGLACTMLVVSCNHEVENGDASLISSLHAQTHKVKKITVLSGDTFDIHLWDGKRVLGYLDVQATPDAAQAVMELLNDSTNPEVIIYERKEGNIGQGWNVTVKVTHEGNRINLSEWLTESNFIWE